MKSIFTTAAMSLLLVSCGGSNDGGSSSSSEALTVQFIDSPVANLNYSTSGGASGVSSSNGSFNCNKGETVTFKVGSTTLGSVTCGNPQVYPTDLTGESKADIANATVAKRMVLLFTSLDSDADPSNGITIPEAAKASVPEVTLSSLADGEVLTFINTVRTGVTNAGGTTQAALANVGALNTALTASATHLSSSVAIYDSLGFKGKTLYSSGYDAFVSFSATKDFFGTGHSLTAEDVSAGELAAGCNKEILTFNDSGANKGKVSRILDTTGVSGSDLSGVCSSLYNGGNPTLETFSVSNNILTIGPDTYCVDQNKDKNCDS